jgi:hypothetical protein
MRNQLLTRSVEYYFLLDIVSVGYYFMFYNSLFIGFQLEAIIREKLKSAYYSVKQAFKQYDPEGRGIITRLR